MNRLLATALLIPLALPAAAERREWTLDLGHAHLGWEIDHMDLARTKGRFDAFDGTFLIDAEEPANSQITITVDAASVNSNHVGRDNHVRSIDYLNVAGFPAITYRSTEIEMLTPTGGKMHGELEMLGRQAPLTLDFEMVSHRTYSDFIPNYDEIPVVSFEATGELLRLDHGMAFIAFPGSPTGMSIDLDIHVDLVDCEGAPDTNVPCNWGRVEGFVGPSES